MPPLSFIAKRFGLFVLIFVSLSVICMNQSVRDAHRAYYCTIAKPIFNIINPHIYTIFLPAAPENNNGWNISFLIYDESKHKVNLSDERVRRVTKPDIVLFQNVHDLLLVPTLFLIALFFASPVTWKKKLLRFPLAMLIFYIFMTLYLSFRFEQTVNGGTLAFDSLWHCFIWLFGLGGTTDPIYIVALFIWGVLIVPSLLKEDILKLK